CRPAVKKMIATVPLVLASTLQRLAAFAERPRLVSDRGDRATVFQARAPSFVLHRSSPAVGAASRPRRHPVATSAIASAVRAVAADDAQAPRAVSQSHPVVDSDSPAAVAEPSRTGSSFCRAAARTDQPAPAGPAGWPGPVRRRARPE